MAASVSEIKAFALTEREDDRSLLQVNKLEVPSHFSKSGAKELAISPDGKWLCLVRPDSTICIVGINDDADVPGRPRISSQVRRLYRVQRHLSRGKLHHGTLGAYDRTVRCLAFSSDSKILACGDLAGFIDAWVLKEVTASLTNGDLGDDKSPNADSSDDSSDGEEEGTRSPGPRWVRPSLDSPMPRLKAGILLISFRPSLTSQPKPLTNGTHQNSSLHTPSSSDDRLVVLTAEHHLFEFNLLQGTLTHWSRRNPKEYLPKEFTIIKDRAMGALWDIGSGKERLWLYGPNWLWMFDLSRDFPAPRIAEGEEKAAATSDNSVAKGQTPSKKRKRREHLDDKIKQPNTGAGDRMPLSQTDIGLGRKMRKVTGDDGSTAQWVPLEQPKPIDYSQVDDDDDDIGIDHFDSSTKSILANYRREHAESHGTRDHAHDDEDSDDSDQDVKAVQASHSSSAKPLPSPSAPSTTTSSQIAVAVVIPAESHSRSQSPKKQPSSRQNGPSHSDDVEIVGASSTHMQKLPDTDGDNDDDDEDDTSPPSTKKSEGNKITTTGRQWWHTFKYREILGMVPLSSAGEEQPDGAGLEIAVVERPMWDVALPGRYVRDYE